MVKSAMIDDTPISKEIMNEMLEDLHEFISTTYPPKPQNEEAKKSIHSCYHDLSARLAEMRTIVDKKKKSFSESFSTSLTQIQSSLKEYSAELLERPEGKRLIALYDVVSEDYEEMLSNIKTQKITKIKAIHLKPVNYARNVFHAMNGIVATVAYSFFLSREACLVVILSMLSLAAFCEISRRFSPRWNDYLVDKIFGVISRPHERYAINGSTHYLIALTVLLVFFSKPVALIAVLVLGFADPAASVFGKLYGRRKLFKDKSFVGTSVFFAVAMVASLGYMLIAVPSFSFAYALLTASVVSLVATATELFSVKIDDNLSIPIVTAIAASFFF